MMLGASIAGCGRVDGPARHHLSGSISFQGQPIPYGSIVFSPQRGPGTTADIENGRYATPQGWGTVGGLHSVEIVAFDGKAFPDPNVEGGVNRAGKQMFRCTLQREIPKEESTWDIELTRQDVAPNGEAAS